MVLGLSLFFVSAARADTWSAGAFTDLRSGGVGQLYLDGRYVVGSSKYATVYASTGDLFHIGNVSSGFYLEFTSGFDLGAFLRRLGLPER